MYRLERSMREETQVIRSAQPGGGRLSCQRPNGEVGLERLPLLASLGHAPPVIQLLGENRI